MESHAHGYICIQTVLLNMQVLMGHMQLSYTSQSDENKWDMAGKCPIHSCVLDGVKHLYLIRSYFCNYSVCADYLAQKVHACMVQNDNVNVSTCLFTGCEVNLSLHFILYFVHKDIMHKDIMHEGQGYCMQ